MRVQDMPGTGRRAGVSCPATTNCMGVGWYYDASSNEFPLSAPCN